MRVRSRIGARLLIALLSALVLTLAAAGPAFAQGPVWHLSVETAPTNLPPGGEGQLQLVVSNLGDAPIDGGGGKAVIVTDQLPAGLTATAIRGPLVNNSKVECALVPLGCSFKGVLNPYERFAIELHVKVEEATGTVTTLSDAASVEGGGAAKVASTLRVPVNGETAGFGVASFEIAPLNENGAPGTQAGSQPFQLTTVLALNQLETANHQERYPVELPRDLSFHLPPGLVGNPTAVTQCTMANFFALVFETNLCPPSSVVGVATVTAREPAAFHVFSRTVPVFNLVPAHGEPARFGFEVIGKVPVVINTSVRSGRDYGVDASVKNATQTAGLLSSRVTLWGVPGDPRHNNARGWECIEGGRYDSQIGRSCLAISQEPEAPFLTLPSACAADPQAEPVTFAMEADSWAHPGVVLGAEYAWMNEERELLGFEGCDQLPFSPSIDVIPEEHTAATPTGLTVDVTLPQRSTLEAGKVAEADVRDTTVTLPEGVQLNPSAANGLEGCSEAQIGFTGFDQATQTNEFNTAPVACPDGSKVGRVSIKTPLLSNELEGWVYLASPAPNGEEGRNPFNSLIALYLVAEDPVSGVLVKLAGEGQVDEGTLRISTTFKNTPQVPFEDLKLDLFGGPRASVSTPPLCGSYATDALFTPWSTPEAVSPPQTAFSVTSGVGGSGCPGVLPFAPGFVAGSDQGQAGAFTGFNLELSRPDGDQALGGLSMHLPSGVAALLSSVELCGDAQRSRPCDGGRGIGFRTIRAGRRPGVHHRTLW
jgi:uncharacterized repeat protein (TIGR01451 family)